MKKKSALLLLVSLLVLCVALSACAYITTHTVTFETQDGQTPIVKVFDETFTVPTPIREGYAFGGWYTNSACSDGKEWYKPASLNANITVYAKWTALDSDVFTVTFDSQNGNALVTKVFDSTFTMPENPTKSGYDFGDGTPTALARKAPNGPFPKRFRKTSQFMPSGQRTCTISATTT